MIASSLSMPLLFDHGEAPEIHLSQFFFTRSPFPALRPSNGPVLELIEEGEEEESTHEDPIEGLWLRADLDHNNNPIVTQTMHNDMAHQMLNFDGWGGLARCRITGTYFRVRGELAWVNLAGAHFRFREIERFAGITGNTPIMYFEVQELDYVPGFGDDVGR